MQQPIDDATQVPRNTELRVGYFSGTGASPAPVLETDDGQVVPTRWESGRRWDQETFIGRPEQPLSPSTHYRLRHRYRDCAELDAGTTSYCGLHPLCAHETGEVIGEFTTGASTDEQELAKPVLDAPLRERAITCEPNNSCGPCGPDAECGFTIELPALAAGLSYRVERDGKFIMFANTELAVGLGTDTGAGGGHGGGVYALAVVDGLGNRSKSTSVTIPSACTRLADAGMVSGGAGTSTDTSVPATPDSGFEGPMADGGQPEQAAQEDGCSLAASSLGAGSMRGFWPTALALLIARRRRRT